MTEKIIYGIHAVNARLKNTKPGDGVLIVDATREDTRVTKCIKLAKDKGIQVQKLTRKELAKIVSGRHQGLVFKYQANVTTLGEKDLYEFVASLENPGMLLVLDGVTDPQNLGACFRAADGAGVDAIIAPRANSASLTPAAQKVASGAAESVKFFKISNLARVLKKLADDGFFIIGADDKAETSFYGADFSGNIALVLGAEGSGIRSLNKKHCQQLVSIPMLGSVSSLNVASATAVMLYEAMRQRKFNAF